MWKPWWPFQKKEEETKLISIPTDVRVVIERPTFEKLKSYVLAVDTEISGLGLISRRNNVFHISKIFLVKQKVSGASATLDPIDLSKLVNRLIKEGENPATLKFFWHSHCNMGAFWSGTDTDTMERYMNESDSAPSQYLISLVVNKSFEYLCRLDIYQPLRITIDRIPLEIIGDSNTTEDPTAEVKEKVSGYSNNNKGWTPNNNSYEVGCLICGGNNKNCVYCGEPIKS